MNILGRDVKPQMHASACKYHRQWLHKAEDPLNCYPNQQFYPLLPTPQVLLVCRQSLQENQQKLYWEMKKKLSIVVQSHGNQVARPRESKKLLQYATCCFRMVRNVKIAECLPVNRINCWNIIVVYVFNFRTLKRITT